jgi:hypothetical protein
VNTVILTTLMTKEKIMFNLANIIAIVPKHKDPTHTAIVTVDGEEFFVSEDFNTVISRIPWH